MASYSSSLHDTQGDLPDILGYKFSVRALGRELPPSLPLVLSDELEYDPKTHTIARVSSAQPCPELVIVHSSLELIKSLGRKPLAVLSICGPYRSGKSYFISRFLGSKEVFKISNTDDPCTLGIWMSSSVLECEDFAILLIDTEGMESLEASEEYIVKLLVVTTILSSTLIYNSIGIPERSDLENLSFFSNATSSIIVKSGAESDDLYKHFPNFLWLVRDATLKYSGTPTDYIKNEVLVRSSRVNPDRLDCIVQTITCLFPSVECRMLPRPSVDPTVLADMISNESRVNPEFIHSLQEAYRHLCSSIRPKGFDIHASTTAFSGLVIAELLKQYVCVVNADQDIVLQTCWQSAFQSALYSYSTQLVLEYQQQMKHLLQAKLPIEQGSSDDTNSSFEGETLMQIHDHVASSLYDDLCQEIQVLLGSSSSSDVASNVQHDFQSRIAVYDMVNHRVEGGELLNFVNDNYSESTKVCQNIFDSHYSTLHKNVMDAHRDKKEIDMESDIETLKTEYYKEAVGPAKDEVLKLGVIKLQTASDSLSNIPGPPAHMTAIKISKDEITIKWNGAAFNSKKVTKYIAECTEAESALQEWITIPVDECTATANELKPHTKYLFRVHAYINEHKSRENTISVTTKVSSAARTAATIGAFIGGTLITPVASVAVSPVLAPAMTVVGLFSAPVLGGYCAKKVYKKCSEENIPYYPWRPH